MSRLALFSLKSTTVQSFQYFPRQAVSAMAISSKSSLYLLTVLLWAFRSLALASAAKLQTSNISPRQNAGNSTVLVMSATYTNAQNNTAFQCWQMTNPFITSATSGLSGAAVLTFPNVTSLTYTYVPPGFDGGVHTAAVPQYVFIPSSPKGKSVLQMLTWAKIRLCCLRPRRGDASA